MTTIERFAIKECRTAIEKALEKIEKGVDVGDNVTVVRYYTYRINEILSGSADQFRLYLLVNNYCSRKLDYGAFVNGTWDRWERILHWTSSKLRELA